MIVIVMQSIVMFVLLMIIQTLSFNINGNRLSNRYSINQQNHKLSPLSSLSSLTMSIYSSNVQSMLPEYESFIKNVACTTPPKSMPALLELLSMKGEELVSPTTRVGLNPFLIPLAKSKDGSMICYIRWPTQKDDMDLQIVRTNEIGIRLLSMGTDQLCHRITVELDFYSDKNAPEAIEIANKCGVKYNAGDYLPFLRSGKFPTLTKEDLGLVLDRFLLTKVGAFPDCYERIAENFVEKGNSVSALVTCERAVSIFYGWGHPVAFHAQMLKKISGYDAEARETARASMGQPAWTIASTRAEMDEIAKLAGYTGSAILGEMHAYRAKDPRKDDIGEGMSPLQVTLDQAAHLMDAIALGHLEGGWEANKAEIAEKYKEGGYPKMAEFILS